jgi:hypothetical protein
VVRKAKLAQEAPSTLTPANAKYLGDAKHKAIPSINFDFEDLPKFKCGCYADILIQRQHPRLGYHFASPQTMEAKRHKPPPSQFSFQALAQLIAEQGDEAFQP